MNLMPFKQRGNDRLSEFFNDDFFFGSLFPAMERALVNNRGGWCPAMDVEETKDAYIVRADLPGLKKEDIRVSCENGTLTIEGERKVSGEEKGNSWHRIERAYGKFVRSLTLGYGVDDDKIRASYKDGVLELSLPKTEKAKPRAIDIHVA